MAAENTSGSSNRIVAETKFKGEINSKSDFRIDGEVEGVLSLKSTAVVEGEVYVDKLSIEPGAVFNVTCTMKGGKNFTNEKQQNANEKPLK